MFLSAPTAHPYHFPRLHAGKGDLNAQNSSSHQMIVKKSRKKYGSSLKSSALELLLKFIQRERKVKKKERARKWKPLAVTDVAEKGKSKWRKVITAIYATFKFYFIILRTSIMGDLMK